MRLEILKYLYDIDHACELLAQFTSGKGLEDYQADPMLRSAVERQFEIVGEALNQALRREPTLADQISHSGRIVAFRNRLIHGYATVADEMVWGIVESYLPVLKQEVAVLLQAAR
ncbi:antitoxin [Desulfuromonas versatilis]|uniref:Antitoxin n=1 Tax=Desulfuromonas versatilis TaxID=2802975 RepID=A0ABM8HR07_9BACT|nr:HepT-like ribonuclease domain-containing protein [Desulfuromonas versatilis]BCR04325.1 antitoxin [Desulfuromonas versatilis]